MIFVLLVLSFKRIRQFNKNNNKIEKAEMWVLSIF